MESDVRGTIFEVIIKKLLEKNEYENIPDDNKTIKNGKIKGRGTWHQIDAFGRFSYPVPFIYPIRLIAEAKWYDGNRKKAGLDTVRNFVGALKDISENYFVEDGQSIDEQMLSKRYTECGSIFSVNGFTEDAQNYAYAQCVSLISYENHPIIGEIVSAMRPILELLDIEKASKNKKSFSEWFYFQLSNSHSDRNRQFIIDSSFFEEIIKVRNILERINVSTIGIVSGVYPIHILSYQNFPVQLFTSSDEQYCRIYFQDEQNVINAIPSDASDVELVFSIPRKLILRHVLQMLEFKKRFFHYIDIPIKINGIRRIIKLNLDEEWVEKLEKEAEPLRIKK